VYGRFVGCGLCVGFVCGMCIVVRVTFCEYKDHYIICADIFKTFSSLHFFPPSILPFDCQFSFTSTDFINF